MSDKENNINEYFNENIIDTTSDLINFKKFQEKMEVNKNDPNFLTNFMEVARKKINEINIDGELEEISQRIISMINYVIKRVDYYEESRNSVRNRIQLIIILIFTYSGLYLTNIATTNELNNITLKVLIGISILFPILYAIKSSIRFELDTSPEYAYRRTAKSPWYYRYILSKEFSNNIGNLIIKEENDYTLHGLYFNDLFKFIKSQTITSKKERLLMDIEQLFIIHIISGYKHKFVQKLADNQLKLIIFVTLSICLTLFYSFLISTAPTNCEIFIPFLVWSVLIILTFRIRKIYLYFYKIVHRF